MPVVSVRLTEDQKKAIARYGTLSDAVREGIQLYLKSKKFRGVMRRLEELQAENPVKTTTGEEARLIREDRGR